MLIVNTDFISGHELETLSMVYGSTIQCKNIGHDITQGLKTLVGGELKAYNQMMEDARKIALQRLEAAAAQLGADAVINLRFNSATVAVGAAEILAYGTAVRFK